ncbi:MAG: ATP-binding protein [Flavobacteriaceae bacterium]|nr:ATP-binding protein [Flavobacteriaceae bacterium]
MINKRLLVKSLLSHNGENSFYDKKSMINIGTKEGKAKFLKHVCALANSNPKNRSFIVIGVSDTDNLIVGVDFFDDSKIQNLVNAYLNNAPIISYENIHFPDLEAAKVIGLVTISSSGNICSLKKNIWKYYLGTVFIREGSISLPKETGLILQDLNAAAVAAIELSAQNNIKLTLDGVIDFINNRHKDLECHYRVFKDQFVVCWAGIPNKQQNNTYFSRVDIELITEQVKLFYSDLDEVMIDFDNDSFTIVEYVSLGLGTEIKYYPLEKTQILFKENGTYRIDTSLMFAPPLFDLKLLHHVFNNSKFLVKKIQNYGLFTQEERLEIDALPQTLLLCYLNGFLDAKVILEKIKPFLKGTYATSYTNLKEAQRIIRKVKYN